MNYRAFDSHCFADLKINVLPGASATEESESSLHVKLCASLKQQLILTMVAEDDYPAVMMTSQLKVGVGDRSTPPERPRNMEIR